MRAALRRLDELMQHAAVAIRLAIANNLDPPIAVVAREDAEEVVVERQGTAERSNVEPIWQKQHIVGVHDEGVIGLLKLPETLEGNCAVRGEILPGLIKDQGRQ